MDEQVDLTQQVKKLHRDMLWTRYFGGLVILLLTAFILSGRNHNPKTVAATEFLLKDGAGNVVARLAKQAGGTCLTLMTNSSFVGAKLCSSDGSGPNTSSYLVLNDGDGVSQASLSAGFNTLDLHSPIESGLFIQRKEQYGRFLNLNLGTETELVIGNLVPNSYRVSGPDVVNDYNVNTPRVTISVSEDKPAINLFGELHKKIWSTQQK